ncbi:winged helix-turn-helix transcriptional regulator [Streptomyces sp. NPDC019539]|uniref:winged helix-turn-helix transcriptional regulator n=1 Tax=Streptomyces sp. NPDC019539 TaxID=3365063 RepID=UPI00379C3351
MDWLEFSTDNCSVQRTVDLVGEKWSLLILRDAVNGIRRFDHFRRHVGLSEAVLADRLRKLVAAGILETTPYRDPGNRTRHEYRLTAKGWDLWPVLVALMQWGDKHAADPGGPSVTVRHTGCGAPVRLTVGCDEGHHALAPRDVTATPGPSASRHPARREP